MYKKTTIFGAGIAGLLAANTFQKAEIYDSGNESQVQHKALLRFRTSEVGDSVGIDFKKVKVHKGVWIDSDYVSPNIRLANMYSRKVIGKVHDRSIWNVDSVYRYIAPENFVSELADRCKDRIVWGHTVTKKDFECEGVKISTIPLSVTHKILCDIDLPVSDVIFKNAPITVKRYRIKDCDVFQTVYFPSPETSVYRASITKDLLIVESIGESLQNLYDVLEAFGLNGNDIKDIDSTKQGFGKIYEVDDVWRKNFIYKLSLKHDVFSLGRFGTWRNILLDDVLKDVGVIKKLMSSSNYDRKHYQSR